MSYPELVEDALELEEEVLRTWAEEDTFRLSLAAREGESEYVFYEGPPTANGRPGVHHIPSRTIKDLLARYWTMRGHHVTRIAGWDTHGLPVEVEAEKQLGISGKPEIEELGIGEFNRVCRENIFTYKEDWEELSTRIGYWLDYDEAYITCSPDYVESCWWAVKEIAEKGLLYRGYRVVPYCPRCGTGLSSHEVAQGYAHVTDRAVFVKFHLVDDPDDARILSWTTTPWTLPGNLALAVAPDVEYVRVRVRAEGASEPSNDASDGTSQASDGAADPSEGRGAGGAGPGTDGGSSLAEPGEVLVLARDRMEEVLEHEVEVLEVSRGRELVGLRYRPLFPGAVDAAGSDRAWSVVPADFVTTDEGTGVVHTAVMYGEEDFELGREVGLPMQHTVDEDGRFVDRLPQELAGRYVKDPQTEEAIVRHLRSRDSLYREEPFSHSYPHCWRCDSALLYMARESWYVETTAVKERLLEENASVDWHPPEIGRGRMGEWLENNVDWALSRDRYWGTPLPVWECDREREHRQVVGSYRELARRADGLPEDFDPHRPAVDRITWPCPETGCGGTMHRHPAVLDAWFDSGSMPYAQWHHPFENEEEFRRHFPADFIAEGVDQTRGWFYSLLALSVILFDRSAYRSVVVNELVLDEEGQKMSKSRGNAVDPWDAVERHGADAIRFYLMSVSNPWLPKRWDPEAIGEVDRKLLDTLRNTYRFFAMYANLEGWTHGDATPLHERPVMDRWLLGRLDAVSRAVRDELERADITRAARRISGFVVDDLSNWYVRRTRERFWATGSGSGREELRSREAFDTLHEALVTVSLLLAPFAPFLSDWLHRALTDGSSVHLGDFPAGRGRHDAVLDREMEDARRLAGLGRAARESAGIKVRQPLRRLRAVIPGDRRLSPEVAEVLAEELNVKEVVFPDTSDEIIRLSVKPDYSRLGPRFQERTPAVAAAVEGLEAGSARRLRDGRSVHVEVGGDSVEVGPEEVSVLEEGREGVAVESEAGYLAALDRTLDEELRSEGLARELVSRIQRLRRDSGLEVEDRIHLSISGDESLERAVRRHEGYVAGETLATRLTVGDGSRQELPHVQELEVEGHAARIGIGRRERSITDNQ